MKGKFTASQMFGIPALGQTSQEKARQCHFFGPRPLHRSVMYACKSAWVLNICEAENIPLIQGEECV